LKKPQYPLQRQAKLKHHNQHMRALLIITIFLALGLLQGCGKGEGPSGGAVGASVAAPIAVSIPDLLEAPPASPPVLPPEGGEVFTPDENEAAQIEMPANPPSETVFNSNVPDARTVGLCTKSGHRLEGERNLLSLKMTRTIEADLNRDGQNDLVAIKPNQGAVYIFLRSHDKRIESAQRFLLPSKNFSIALGRLCENEDETLFIFDWESSQIRLLKVKNAGRGELKPFAGFGCKAAIRKEDPHGTMELNCI